jgi:hypothetical protein
MDHRHHHRRRGPGHARGCLFRRQIKGKEALVVIQYQELRRDVCLECGGTSSKNHVPRILGIQFEVPMPGTTSLSQDDSTSMAIRNENFPSEGYSIRQSGDEFENKMSKMTIEYDNNFCLNLYLSSFFLEK